MPKYKIAIQKQIPDYSEIAVECEEKSKKEAMARSQKIINEVAEQYSEGCYTGGLYRKSFFFGWCRVSTPVIICTNKNR